MIIEIDGKQYKVEKAVADHIKYISLERDELQDELQYKNWWSKNHPGEC